MAAEFDLTGTYSADDGGIYFIRQLGDGSVTWAGLHQDGFHNGLVFTNVFQGQLEPDGLTVTGDWLDVPRGGSANSGTLTFEIVPAVELGFELPVQLKKIDAGSTGPFGGSTWTIGSYELSPQNITEVESKVQRYDVPLGQNNPPCRDFSVMWGWVQKTTGPTLPRTPDLYCSFLAKDWIGQPAWSGDGDFSFDFDPDFAMLEPDFWTHGWTDQQFTEPGGTILLAQEHILTLYDYFQRFHCEGPMYARANDHSHCADAPIYLLPAWYERGGHSILVNGQPINSNLEADSTSITFTLGPELDTKITLTKGVLARVTGVVADDAGHEDQVPPEIHPLYSIDVIQDFGRTRGSGVVGPNLSGAWHGNDIGTYYVRQTGDQVWWLGLSRDQGRSFANVFRGTLNQGILEGSWVDVPIGAGGVLGTGDLTIFCGTPQATELIKISTTDTFGATRWTKLYDTPSEPPPVQQSA